MMVKLSCMHQRQGFHFNRDTCLKKNKHLSIFDYSLFSFAISDFVTEQFRQFHSLLCGGYLCKELSLIICFVLSCASSFIAHHAVRSSLTPSRYKACCMLCYVETWWWEVLIPLIPRSRLLFFSPPLIFFSIVSLIFSAFLFLFWYALLFSPHSHPSMSCCLSSEVHCLRFTVWANRRDDLLPHFYLSCPNWTTEEF